MKRVVAAWLGAMVASGVGATPADTVVDVARATVRLPAGEWVSAPDEMVMASAEIGSRMGALMSVEVLADVDFAGAPAADQLPSTVDDRHAAFALQLAQRVRDCVYSIRGRMDVPPITFISAAPPEVRIARLDP